MATSLSALQGGNPAFRFVVCVDGYPHVFSNAPQAAVQTSWASTDFATKTVIPNIIVELDNHQEIDPWKTFMGGGTCTVRIQPDDGDTIGIDVHRVDYGNETQLTSSINRVQILNVAFTDPFASGISPISLAGEGHIGTECFEYHWVSGGRFGIRGQVAGSRGKYVAAGVKNSVSTYSAVRFSENHRVVTEDNGIPLRPVVSQYPRSWRGRRLSVWLHTWDESTQSLNLKSDALCVFVGTLTEARDDAQTGDTVLFAEHELNRISNCVIGRDMYKATLAYGQGVFAGQTFGFRDFNGTVYRTANNLTVVANGATGTNQVNAGAYSVEEWCSIINQWLQGEVVAARIHGNYTLNSPEDVNGQPRTVMHFYIPGSGTASWRLQWPNSTWGKGVFGAPSNIYWWPYADTPNAAHAASTNSPPSPGGMIWSDWSDPTALAAKLDTSTGIFFGQYDTLPPAVKATLPANGGAYGNDWGLFVLEGDTPIIFSAAIQNGYLRYIQGRNAEFGTSLSAYSELQTITVPWGGAGPAIRQIFVHSAPCKTILKWLLYSTGTQGYNHPDYDLLPVGGGGTVNVPADYLGSEFETSCDLLPGANDLLTITIDKPKKFSELVGMDLLLRTTHLVWRSGAFKFMSWTTPSSGIATVVLGESSKSAPADTQDNHRTASVLDSSWVRNLVKILYNRDLLKNGSKGDAVYNSPPIIIGDATSIDDQGGIAAPVTLELSNVYGDTAAISAGVTALAKGLTAWLPWFSRPVWKVTRSIDLTHFEGFGVGEIIQLTDPFIRDPTTGRRGISNRGALVIRHRYRIAEQRPPGKVQFSGEMDVVFVNIDRIFSYSPAAELDDTASGAGYDGILTLTFKAHEHSESTETVDIGRFASGDVVTLVEVDPTDPANPDTWTRTLNAVTPALNQATITLALAAPAFNSSKKYRLVPAGYTSTQSTQKTKSFQASAGTRTISELAPPDQYGSTSFLPWWGIGAPSFFDHTKLPELAPNLSYGPNAGAPRDAAYDQELMFLIDNMMDHKMNLSSPLLNLATRHRTTPNGTSISSGTFFLLDVTELYLGDMLMTGSVQRYLYLAPRWRTYGSTSGFGQFDVTLRISISGFPPAGSTRSGSPSTISDVLIKAPAAGNTWTKTNYSPSTWTNDTERGYPLVNFNKHQWVYIIVEGTTTANYRGLHQLRMGERLDLDSQIRPRRPGGTSGRNRDD